MFKLIMTSFWTSTATAIFPVLYKITIFPSCSLLLIRLLAGFIEGGELHGIVSIKILDAFNKKDIERA